MKIFKAFLFVTLVLFLSNSLFAQSVKIGPRITGNYNIYNRTSATGSWNGIGIGIGGTIDVSFSPNIGIMGNLTFFDMKSFSHSETVQTNVGPGKQEYNLSLSYLTIDPMFKAEFSGFYMVAGPSLGLKLASSGESILSATGYDPVTTEINPDTKSLIFNIAVGAGYTLHLGGNMYLGSDFMAYIPLTDTYDIPSVSNKVLSLKLGVALKFKI